VLGDHSVRTGALSRVGRVIDYLFGLLYTLLLVRFALEFFEARRDTGFFRMIQGLTDAFYRPFKGIVATTTVDGARIVWPLVVTIVAYMLLHAILRGLLRLLASI
jgi:uncharacterized protein YggT (Ycf19 family)